MRKEFDSILGERNVVASLNELDRLIEDAKKRRKEAASQNNESEPLPAHTLPARQLYVSHLAPILSKYSANMSERQDLLCSENLELMERIQQQRQNIQKLLDGLENVVEDLKGSLHAMEPEQMDKIREEVRDADEMMRD